MSLHEVVQYLESVGTEQNRKIYRNHGANGALYGVSFKELRALAKKIKKDHELALQLWQTQNIDCQILATMLYDPKQLTYELLSECVNQIDYYTLLDEFTQNTVYKTQYVDQLIEEWVCSSNEYVARAGYNLVGLKALKDKKASNDYFNAFIQQIKETIHNKPNRTKQSMLNCLIAIGVRNDELERLVLSANKEIGTVTIDHGDTYCQTPDVEDYLKRTKKHRNRK